MVQPGMIYEHYKKKKYLVLNIAKHSETLEDLVIYVSLYENDMSYVWVRPLKIWEETIKNAEGEEVPRFKLIGPAISSTE